MKFILTGHSRGIGRALAELLLARGFDVLAIARQTADDLAQRYPAQLKQVALDLADSDALIHWIESGALSHFATDADALVLINNAGMLGPMAPPGRQSASAIAHTVALNVTAPLLLSDAVMRSFDGPVRIAHLSSGAGRTAYPGWGVYCATKAALDHHARSVALEGVPRLRISSVAPGVVDTTMQSEIRAATESDFPLRQRFVDMKDHGQLATPEAVAARLLDHLLSADFGHEIVVDLRSL